MLNIKEIKEIYKSRNTNVDEWLKLKKKFIEESLSSLVDEECGPWVFHIVYYKIVNISDRGIYDALVKEYK